MTLHLHTAERTDALADGLADLLVTPLPDPFAREVVVVPARAARSAVDGTALLRGVDAVGVVASGHVRHVPVVRRRPDAP